MGFEINCLKPGMILIKINVEPFHTIQKLLKIAGSNCTLIYNQMELLPSNTVDFYKITPGSSVVAVDINDKKQINFWKGLSQSNEFMKRISGTHVLSREKENIRLTDIRYSKMELKSKAFARKMCSIADEANLIKNQTPTYTPTKYEKPETLCSNPLPIFWNTQSLAKKDILNGNQTKIPKSEFSSDKNLGIAC